MIPSYCHTRHWPSSLTVHRDDHYHPRPERFVGIDVVITEKIDGGVCGINKGEVYARSSGEPTRQPWFSYVKANTAIKFSNEPPQLVYWGEDVYGIHSIEYDVLPDSFFLFHILERKLENIGMISTQGDVFWSWDEVAEAAKILDIFTVPVLFEGKFKTEKDITEWFSTHISYPSRLGPSQEGFVMRIRDRFLFDDFEDSVCKYVRKNHVQTDRHWSKGWKSARIVK